MASTLLTLTATTRPDSYTLTCDTLTATIEMRQSVIFNDLLRRLSSVLIGSGDSSGQLSPLALLRDIGTRLWHMLIPATFSAVERDTLSQILRASTDELQLTLPSALAVLPWELLCDPQSSDDTGFLARRRPLVRLFPGGTLVAPLSPPLRVLLLISSPSGLDDRQRVDVESERAAVESATQNFRQDGFLHLYIEDRVTLRRVQQDLMRFKPHIVHYIGHGGYEPQVGGILLWEDDHGNPLAVPDTRVAELLRPRNLRAVLLHGCETAITSSSTTTALDIRGVARTLLHAGIPAVLAQQASFTYESSQRASEAFYTALTSGLNLSEATFEVRQSLAQADRPDWAVPTLQSTLSGLIPLLDEGVAPAEPDPALKRSGAALDLPAPTGVFVGRQRELRALRNMLESNTGPVIALITGPGGVGKSTLAAQAVTRYGNRYSATLTLSCLGYQDFDLFLQRIAEFLKRHNSPTFLDQTLPDPKLSIATKIGIAIETFNTSGPYLLLIDNLESTQQDDRAISDPNLHLFLQKILTNQRTGRTLITGRYTVKDLLPNGKFAANLLHINLDDLSQHEIYLLLDRHPNLARLSRTTKNELVREFGGLPYVYDLLSSKAAKMNLDVLIHDVQGRITSERQQRTAKEWNVVRQEVVEFAALDAVVARLSEAERTLLAKLSVFRRPFPLEAMEQGLEARQGEWNVLIDWGLLRFDGVERVYQLHSLTRYFAKNLPDNDIRIATLVRVAEWYEHYADEGSHNLFDYLAAHDLLREADEVENAVRLLLDLTLVLHRFGSYKLLQELYTTALDDNLSESLVTYVLHNLGSIARLQGDYEEARRLYGESLQIKERVGDEAGRAATLGQLGLLARDQGDIKQALEYTIQALKIFERLQSPNRNLVLQTIAEMQAEIGESAFVTLWQEVSDGLPMPEITIVHYNEDLLQRLMPLLASRSVEEVQLLLEQDSELISIEAEELLGALAEAQEDEDVRNVVERRRVLLARCREVGIATAFAEINPYQEPLSDNTTT